ncbi:MAG: FAD-dependent oxidoreductase [Xanthobacteraceae bacterium]|nr:FAD-dependent oxidoreductase [Xanthobacteraceae bacterium]QYK45875.1 MAG: FAD-dependent oxidoreductase [Xanthobacteraceae bacterium]
MSAGNEKKSVYQFGYRRSPDQDASAPVRRPVVIVGAGPVGLTAALDLAKRCIPAVILDDADRIGEGSRAICFSKRSLEIMDRLDLGDRLVEKGVTWQLGKVFLGEKQVYSFDLLPEPGHGKPAFINIQQYYLEGYLVERAQELPQIDLRWRNRVTGVERHNDFVRLTIETPDGEYKLDADWCLACDGARSKVRDCLGLKFEGHTFEERFLIADVKMAADYPTERWFWFDPPFHSGQSALLHRQPDNVWRIDLQLGPDADPETEKKPERVLPRLKRMLGERAFELEWVSVYRFNCARLARFVHGRVIFAGDSAHQVSPFGARGANSGIQDAENLCWKLALVMKGEAPASLLESYETERGQAADENIGHSTRSTDFIAPRTAAERVLRNAVLQLAPHANFARRMVNSGRLSVASRYDSLLSTEDREHFGGSAVLGHPVPDAPVLAQGKPSFLLRNLGGEFEVLYVQNGARPEVPEGVRLTVIGEDLIDAQGLFATRFDATPGATYVLRPDQHLCARMRVFDAARVRAAVVKARGLN